MDSFDKIRSLKVDVCCGLAWGDEAKGKIVSQLASSGKYNLFVDGLVDILLVIQFIKIILNIKHIDA